jgi:hypothetical protein
MSFCLCKSCYNSYVNWSTLLSDVFVGDRKFFGKQMKGCYAFLFISFGVYFFKILCLWAKFIRAIYIRIFLVYNNFVITLRLLILFCDGVVRVFGICMLIDSYLRRNIRVVFCDSFLYVTVPISDSFLCTTIPVSDFLCTK